MGLSGHGKGKNSAAHDGYPVNRFKRSSTSLPRSLRGWHPLSMGMRTRIQITLRLTHLTWLTPGSLLERS